MGSYKWGSKSPNRGYNHIVTLIITPLITTHEPPSMISRLRMLGYSCSSYQRSFSNRLVKSAHLTQAAFWAKSSMMRDKHMSFIDNETSISMQHCYDEFAHYLNFQ